MPVAISIPIFISHLEKSREAVDAANIRAKYAECQAALLTDEKIDSVKTLAVTLKQTVEGWAKDPDFNKNLGITVVGTPKAGGSATFSYTPPAAGKEITPELLTLTYSS